MASRFHPRMAHRFVSRSHGNGFKSIKSIVRFTFTDKRPVTFWERHQPQAYGFWANVNPDVPHPRWIQAFERVLGTDERRPTRIWNGYGEFVAEGQGLFK